MSEKIIEFLSKLKENNNRDWFKANKPYFEEVKNDFSDMVAHLIRALAVTNSEIANLEAKDTIFRIYRDVRFGKDKSPYKISMGAIIAPGGRKSYYAGHYLHVEPGGSFLAGGLWRPPSDKLKKVRSEIYYNSSEFKSIISDVDFKRYFGGIEGSKLVRPPVGFPKDFADIDLLKFKDFIVSHQIDDNEVVNAGFMETSINIFEKMNPFIGFLNRALEGA